jgi:hypothetical protein
MSVVRRALKICIKSTNTDCGEEVNKTMKVCPFDQFLLKVDARIVRELGNRNSTPALLGVSHEQTAVMAPPFQT